MGSSPKDSNMALLLTLACLTVGWVQPPAATASSPPPTPLDVVSALETVVADAIARAEPSVVAIHRFKDESSQETLAVRGKSRLSGGAEGRRTRARLPLDPEQISFDYGSGVVIGTEGQILTAFHVVRGATQLVVRAADRQTFEAEVIAADPRSDLAVIVPVSGPGVVPPRLKPLSVGDASRLRKGSFLIALGNPFNAARDGKPSASWGILSNVARKLEPELDEIRRLPQFPNYPTLLQLDAKLNLGMSGGAVVNMKGELVGLTTMAASASGFDVMAGYAIPMDRIGRRAVETLKQGKEIEYGLLGIRADPNGSNRVGAVSPRSPADQGQLQVNDEIVAVNEIPVNDFDSLILAVNTFSAGDEVRLVIQRGTQRIERKIVLGKFFVDGEVIATNRPAPWRGLRVDYPTTMTLRGLGANALEAFPGGLVVTEVLDNSPAAKAGIKQGTVIFRVEKQIVRTPREFAEAVANLKEAVTLVTDQGLLTVK